MKQNLSVSPKCSWKKLALDFLFSRETLKISKTKWKLNEKSVKKCALDKAAHPNFFQTVNPP